MRRASPALAGTTFLFSIAVGSQLACVPAVDMGGASGSGGQSGAGGMVATGSGGSAGNAGGSSGGASGGGGSGGGSAASGGTGGGAASGGAAGAAGGRGGSGGASADARPGGSGGGAGRDAGSGGAGDGGGAAGPVTFTKIYTEVLTPGCTAPNNACHSVVRDNYFLFNEGEKARSYMLLVPGNASAGTIPQRVNTLLSYASPTNAANPASVRMPPQSGPLRGNPPVMKPPLTAAQLQLIRTWAMSGAKND